jgi:hypothetical protein
MRKLLSALTVPTGLALLIIPAQTQDAPTAPTTTNSRTTMAPGQRIIVANAGAPPGATVTITLHRSPSSMAMARVPSSYWLSPRGRKAARSRFTTRLEVASWWQLVRPPAPPLKLASPGSQAMSPTAAITGSAGATAVVLKVAALGIRWSTSRYWP